MHTSRMQSEIGFTIFINIFHSVCKEINIIYRHRLKDENIHNLNTEVTVEISKKFCNTPFLIASLNQQLQYPLYAISKVTRR